MSYGPVYNAPQTPRHVPFLFLGTTRHPVDIYTNIYAMSAYMYVDFMYAHSRGNYAVFETRLPDVLEHEVRVNWIIAVAGVSKEK